MMRSANLNSTVRSLTAGSLLALLSATMLPNQTYAQSADALEPFLGIWSGVFTTQEHEFWGLEDFVCFPGCSLAAYEQMIGLLSDPANDETPFGALMGINGGFATEHMASVLTPIGRQIQQANTLENDPKLYCQPYGFVREIMNPLPIEIRRDGDDLLIHYEEYSYLRPIYMNGQTRPQHMTPSMLGFSTGRIEGGALVVETHGVVPDRFSDATQGGYTSALTAIERYTIYEDPRRLEMTVTLEDPVVLTEPYVMTKTWLFTPEVELLQDSCADYPGKF